MNIKHFGMTCSVLAVFVALTACQSTPSSYKSPKAYAIDKEAKSSLNKLLHSNKDARNLKKNAKAILVFPKIYKAGFIFGAQYGNGALINPKGRTIGYYNSSAASYGFQAGLQGFGYVLFFMDTDSLSYLDKSAGWELGVGPSIVIVDKGFGKNLTSMFINIPLIVPGVISPT